MFLSGPRLPYDPTKSTGEKCLTQSLDKKFAVNKGGVIGPDAPKMQALPKLG